MPAGASERPGRGAPGPWAGPGSKHHSSGPAEAAQHRAHMAVHAPLSFGRPRPKRAWQVSPALLRALDGVQRHRPQALEGPCSSARGRLSCASPSRDASPRQPLSPPSAPPQGDPGGERRAPHLPALPGSGVGSGPSRHGPAPTGGCTEQSGAWSPGGPSSPSDTELWGGRLGPAVPTSLRLGWAAGPCCAHLPEAGVAPLMCEPPSRGSCHWRTGQDSPCPIPAPQGSGPWAPRSTHCPQSTGLGARVSPV